MQMCFQSCMALPVLGFRYFNIFGPRQNPDGPYAAVIPIFINAIMNNSPAFINGDGEQTRDFTFVENAVQVNIKGMLTENAAAKNKVYNVAIGESYSINSLYDTIKKYLNSNVKAIHRQQRSGDVHDSLADIALAKTFLNYEPSIKFNEGLIKTIEFFKSLHSYHLSKT